MTFGGWVDQGEDCGGDGVWLRGLVNRGGGRDSKGPRGEVLRSFNPVADTTSGGRLFDGLQG